MQEDSMADQTNIEDRSQLVNPADEEGLDDQRPTGMVVREVERREEARRRGDPDPDVQDVSGAGTVSERIERESVTGGHGHGGQLDMEIQQLEKELKR
jgi:hypothetical protein